MKQAKKVAIRVDGSSDIGFGHLMRMTALARELIKQGAEVIFLTKNPEHIENFPVKVIDSEMDFNNEDRRIEELLYQNQAGMIIVDSYNYDQGRLDRMSQLDIRTVYIDDLNQCVFNIDLVVNGNLYAPQMEYKGRAEFLLGAEYLLMREEFANAPKREARLQVKDILLTMGGADIINNTPRILEYLINYKLFDSLCWHVVIGPAFKNVLEIESLAGGLSNIYTYFNPDMKKIMYACDICISAAGSTAYELAACGLPSILIVTADNQAALARELNAKGLL